ncbi:MAG: hypothetical protein LBU76_02465 [Azoarcus sp.]|jgi:hypothetical protein|nr:hypothetical protein [Azoarcus sp.]
MKKQEGVALLGKRRTYACGLCHIAQLRPAPTENGTDLRYIREFLGKSSKATEIYAHVSIGSIQNVDTP